jgi:hypothetical protein
MLSGSMSVKAERRTLMKLTHGVVVVVTFVAAVVVVKYGLSCFGLVSYSLLPIPSSVPTIIMVPRDHKDFD